MSDKWLFEDSELSDCDDFNLFEDEFDSSDDFDLDLDCRGYDDDDDDLELFDFNDYDDYDEFDIDDFNLDCGTYDDDDFDIDDFGYGDEVDLPTKPEPIQETTQEPYDYVGMLNRLLFKVVIPSVSFIVFIARFYDSFR